MTVHTPVTQRGRVANALLQRIRAGEWAVGERLPSERLLANEFGVSRPVIREALGTLGAMEIIESQMGRGSFVRAIDVPSLSEAVDIEQLLDVVRLRSALEAGALTLAKSDPATRSRAVHDALGGLREAIGRGEDTVDADVALHRAMIEAVGSPGLLKAFDDVAELVVRTIHLSPRGHTMGDALLKQHEAIASGMLGGDIDLAIAASQQMHLEHYELLSELLEQ